MKSVTIHHGDSREVIKGLADNSIDSVVCDPPYALVSIVKRFGGKNAAGAKSEGASGVYKRASAGFMGQTWDTGETAFDPEFWVEVMRVLKPGGHLIAASGTRTYHRLAVAIEDAGFEVRDMISWLYGCLSDDTEILTADGWKPGVDVRKGETVAAWDADTGAVVLAPVLEHTLAPYSGDLVRLVNDDTDQLLTPNHRVYLRAAERKMTAGVRSRSFPAAYSVAEAAHINRWNPVKLPCAGFHSGEGIGGLDYAALLGWIWTEGGFDKAPSSGVRVYQSETANPAKVAEIEALFDRVKPDRKRYDRTRPYTYKGITRDSSETCWFFSGELAHRVRADLPDKRPTWSLLWRMTQAEKRAFMDAAMKGDGSGDDFYQKHPDDLTWFQALLSVTGQRGKINLRKAPRDGGGVCITPRETTELQRRHLVNASQPYDGDVWCVRVSTGAFLARRNGKVFITGNSGFPKSHDVSKGIDKAGGVCPKYQSELLRESREAAGLSRAEVAAAVGCTEASVRDWEEGRSRTKGGPVEWITASEDYRAKLADLLEYTADQRELVGLAIDRRGDATVIGLGHSGERRRGGVSALAAQWSGWGTALKPACEPWVLARKPLSGTVAGNVLAHGTGALNIDACRIGWPDGVAPEIGTPGWGGPAKKLTAVPGQNAETVERTPPNKSGRWPANVIHDGSAEVVAAFPDSAGQQGDVRGTEPSKPTNGIYGDFAGRPAQAKRGDEGSAARFFYSAKADADDRMGSKHPTVKPIDLMRYLVRLITPPGGVVLDPFAGSGSTGVAAMLEGFESILIEREAEYVADINRKVAFYRGEGRLASQEKLKAKQDDHADLPLFGGAAA